MAPLLAQKPGVDRAFERIYRRHAVDVYRYAFAVLRNQADAEDVTQTTFMNAYRALDRGETPQTPHNWLIAIAHNVCRQRFRQASRRPLEVGLEDDVADHFVEPEDDNAPSPDDIRRALQHLAFNQRAALVMRELEGRSYAEIADLLDLSVSAVETLIFRARRALREQLEGALTCGQAEHAISRQLDGALSRPERSQLRAHLRECATCRTIARSQRAQRSALRGALGAVPLPTSLASLFGGGGATVGAAVATKAAAVVVAAGVATGVGLDVHHRLAKPAAKHHRTVPAHAQTQQQPAPTGIAPRDAPVAAVVVPRAQPVHRAAHATTMGKHRGHAARTATTPLAPTPPATTTTEEPASPVASTPPAWAGAAAHGNGRGGDGEHGSKGQGNSNSHGHGNQKSDSPSSEPTVPAQTTPTPSDHGNHGHGQSGQGGGQGADKGAKDKAHGQAPPVVPPVTSVPIPTVPEPPVPTPIGDDGGR